MAYIIRMIIATGIDIIYVTGVIKSPHRPHTHVILGSPHEIGYLYVVRQVLDNSSAECLSSLTTKGHDGCLST